MPTTFNVISLGNNKKIDKDDGNSDAENAYKLVGKTFGGDDDPLFGHVQEMAPTEDGIGDTSYYDQDDSEDNGFTLDGGPEQTFDAVAVYEATLTYDDGTTANISAVVFQDTDGNTYLAPEISENADFNAMEAKPIVSMELNSLIGNSFAGLTSSRADTEFLAPCFTAGTRIAVPGGLMRIERLKVGDLVLTADHGPKPIRWIGQAVVRAAGAMVPVRIAARALGDGVPWRDLIVSPQHRMLVRSKIAARMTGKDELLLPAKKLVGLPGIAYDHTAVAVRYLHLLLSGHEILLAEGAPTESLLPADQALKALGPEGRAEIAALFPEHAVPAQPARQIPSGQIARALIARHRRNAKPLIQSGNS